MSVTGSSPPEEQLESPVQTETPAESTTKEITKFSIRKKVWEHLEKSGLASFPRPVYGRIPNFKDSEATAVKLSELEVFQNSQCIEVNPDKPQEPARILALENGKKLYVPVPRLTEGLLKFIHVPEALDKKTIKQAVSRKGIKEGEAVAIEAEMHLDLLVLGSVAVSANGFRVGKGRGYADLEFAILQEMKAVDENTVIVTTVHDSQVFETLPRDLFKPYDVPIDYIVTPTQTIKVENRLPRPPGIIWNLLSQRRVNLMPVLQALKEKLDGEGKDTTLKEVDTDVETNETQRFNKFKRFKRRRPRSEGITSESQGENGIVAEDKRVKRYPKNRRFFRRSQVARSEDHSKENIESVGEGNGNAVISPDGHRQSRRLFRRNRPQIDFSLMVSNIERSVRVRDLKNALTEHGIKPNDITWRGYKGFCYLHYAKATKQKVEVEQPFGIDNVIEILQKLKIGPAESENNLSVKVMEPISRIETTDVTAV